MAQSIHQLLNLLKMPEQIISLMRCQDESDHMIFSRPLKRSIAYFKKCVTFQ